MKLLFIALFISGICYGQRPDSAEMKRQQSNRSDSLVMNAVITDMKITLYGKVSVPYYDAFNELVKEYMKQKSIQWHTKPK